MDYSVSKTKKETVSITIEADLRQQIDDLIYRDHLFSSVSGFANIAFAESLMKRHLIKEELSAADILFKMLQNEEGKKSFEIAMKDGEEFYNKEEDNKSNKVVSKKKVIFD
jgi:hypothetical protein